MGGALGALNGTNEAELALANPGPTALLARTVALYVVPFVRPVMVQLNGPTVQVQVDPPGVTVTT